MLCLFQLLLLVCSATLAIAAKAPPASSRISHRWIVEHTEVDQFGKRSLDPHDDFNSHMKRSGIEHNVRRKFDYPGLLMATTVDLDDSEVERVRALPSVVDVHPVHLSTRHASSASSPASDSIQKRQQDLTAPVGRAINPRKAYSDVIHNMTNAAKVHEAGYLGRGIQVAIIDSGVDYNHPALGGCFGPGCKVVTGWDFIGDDKAPDYDPLNPVEDDRPMDCNGHGTHCAGIVAAFDSESGFMGVAPDVTIAAYRVLDCNKIGPSNEIFLAAALRAFREGADILSMSFGGQDTSDDDLLQKVLSRLVDRGVVVLIAAGNGGKAGLFFNGSPSNAVGSFSVANVVNRFRLQHFGRLANDDSTPFNIAWQPEGQAMTATNTELDVVLGSDLCAAPLDSLDLSTSVTLLVEANCSIADQANRTVRSGGSVALFAAVDLYEQLPFEGVPGLAVGEVYSTVSDDIARWAASEESLRLIFSADPIFSRSSVGERVSEDSTYGPSFDGAFKPDLAAPGGDIFNTVPVFKGSYQVLSGTSMAAPYVSGASALMLQARRDVKSNKILRRFQSTARPVAGPDGKTDIIAHQGAGFLDVHRAIFSDILVSPSEIALNDTEFALLEHEITVNNTGSEAVEYCLDHVPARTALTFNTTGAPSFFIPPALVNVSAAVEFLPPTLRVPAHSSANFTVKFAPPTKGLDRASIPVYSGWIVLAASTGAGQELRVAYQGIAASMRTDFPTLDRSDILLGASLPALAQGSNSSAPKLEAIYAAQGYHAYSFTGNDSLDLLVDMLAASPKVEFVLLSPPSATHPRARSIAKGAGVIGALPLPFSAFPRNAGWGVQGDESGFQSVPLAPELNGLALANGREVPEGDYQVRLRALRTFGDETIDSDWDTWTSPVFGYKKA